MTEPVPKPSSTTKISNDEGPEIIGAFHFGHRMYRQLFISIIALSISAAEILSAKNLYDLAGEIVRVFGFDFDHAFGFYSKLTGDVFGSPVKYELFADMGESEARSVKRIRPDGTLRSSASRFALSARVFNSRLKRLPGCVANGMG